MSSIHERAGTLVRAHLDGDAGALFHLVEVLRPVLLRQAHSILRDEAAAEDVFVETMTELVRRLPTLREGNAVIVYARQVARCRSIDTLRRRAFRDSRLALRGTADLADKEPGRRTAPIERLGGSTSPESHLLRDERLARIHALIDECGDPGASLLRATLDGDSLAKAAARLGLAESTARRALRRTRALLASRLAGFERASETGGPA
ncbi:MAG: sigma-70 family RNA polymerase sigma factor [Deltaproteobacteria bacterium]|nr:sigma-70 family RNA polymerase sigma factor [Deltaproteobacteria bacterium]